MKNLPVYILFWCVAFNVATAKAQDASVFNLNIDNGLPTNYTYCMLVDVHGYLWIATTNGVVRYNGYESKVYDFSAGLPKEEIWRLYEDKKHRIWFSSISPFLGYVHNNKFKIVKNLSGSTLYPFEIKDWRDGVFFLNKFVNRHDVALCYERNDTLYSKNIPSMWGPVSLIDSSKVVFRNNVQYYTACPDFNDSDKEAIKNITMLARGDASSLMMAHVFYKNYLFSYPPSGHYLKIINVATRQFETPDWLKSICQEELVYIFRYDDGYYGNPKLCIVTDGSLYLLDSTLQVKHHYATDTLCDLHDGNKVSFFWQDNFWKTCISTKHKGVFFNYGDDTHFNVLKTPDLTDYQYVGRSSDDVCFWWNNDKNILAKIIHNKKSVLFKLTGISSVNNIVPYSNDTLMLFTTNRTYWIDQRTGKNGPIMQVHKPNKKINISPQAITIGSSAGFICDRNHYYILSKTGGLYQFRFEQDTLFEKLINNERFNTLEYDRLRKNLWVYNNYDLEIYNINGTLQSSLPAEKLSDLKIKNIEKIIIDSLYGNIFLKENDRLLLFDGGGFKYHTLFDNYVLDGALVSMYKGQLIIAGRFGVLFSKIMHAGSLSSPVIYPNIKNIKYNYTIDIQCSNDKVLLKTDRGEYLINIPGDTEFTTYRQTSPIQYRLVLEYNNELYDLKQQDTIRVYQSNMKLHLDVINPLGNGSPHYSYFIEGIDAEWHEVNASEILLPNLSPGSYYKLSVAIRDNSWRSGELHFTLYVIPYWWQQPLWKNVFWACGILLIMLFGLIVAYITRKIVYKSNVKKNMQLELELKAIYSQINPHFIYNTLNSVLFFISEGKMDEAYEHVAKFSKLLRAYVKSSRNKYITVSDELANLKNYIELQQSRFNHKFYYEIVCEDNMEFERLKIPSLLLQPFVENAIHHGLLPKEGVGKLIVRIEYGAAENEIVCMIEDNGIGRALSKSLKKNTSIKTESYGEEIISDLINVFNKYEKMRLEIKYVDKTEPQTGTIVVITLKNLCYEP